MTDALDIDAAIAVTGMACRFPGAPDIDSYWRNLCAAVDTIQRFDTMELSDPGVDHPAFVPACAPIPDPYAFDEVHFGVSPAAARALDPQHRVFVECAWTALEGAGALAAEEVAVAVFAGCSDSTYPSRPAEGGQGSSLAFDISTSSDYLATRTAFLLGLRGPAVTVRTACSTSLVAIHLAVQSLLMNECDFAVAGGAAIRHPLRRGHIHESGGIYSSDGRCRPYDRHASGIVSGDGAGAVVLRRLADAMRDGDHVHAVIRGSAINNDGSAKASFAAPSVPGQVEVALTALEVAGIDPASIGFIEGHGTATPLGDPIEVEALSRVWGGRVVPCVLGSVKSGIGHLDAAAGVASFIKACLAVEHGRIPGTLNYTAPNPHSSLIRSVFAVSPETTDWNADGPRRASVHALGLGGTNAHVVLEQAPPIGDGETAVECGVPVLLPVSTRRPETFGAYANALAETLETPRIDLAVVARTLQDSRVAEPHRRIVVGSNREELARDLRSLAPTSRPAVDRPRVVMAFPGDGKRIRGAVRELSRHLPPVTEVLRESTAHLKARWGVDIAALEFESSARGVLPALVAQGLALHAGLAAFGVRGDVVLGLSLGELTAAAASGVISRTEALDLAMARELAFRAVVPSGALAIGAGPDLLAGRLPADIELSVVNSPDRCVVSGQIAALARFAEEIAADGTPVQQLDVISAVHSSLLDPVLADFRQAARGLTPRQPACTMLSTIGPAEVDERLAADPDHWVRQLREPIRFDRTIRAAIAGYGHAVVVDIGPSSALGTAIRETVGAEARAVVSMSGATEDVSELEAFGAALGQLWEAGVPIDWSAWPRRASRRAVLPVPPLMRSIHAPDGSIEQQPRTAPAPRIALWNRSWRRVNPKPGSQEAKRIAVLTGGDPLGHAVAARLAERGHHVEANADDPSVGEHDLVIDFRAVGASHGPAAASAFLEIAARTSEPLIALTRSAYDVLGTESVSLAAAAVAASALVVAQEKPRPSVSCLDVAAAADADVVAQMILSKPADTLVALRGRRLWVPVIAEVDRPDVQSHELSAGAYVITGGLGRFGRWVGRWLAEHGCRDLILIGRRGLDGPDHRERTKAVAAMRAAGTRVSIVQADLTDHTAISRALDDAHRIGEVTIFHLAGEPHAGSAGALLEDLVKAGLRQALNEQWGAKVAGAQVLLDWTRRHPETRCVSFSSNAAVLGGPGLAAYAAANAALDALAVCASEFEGLNWCSIGWDGWRLPDDPDERTPSALEEFALHDDEPWQALRTAIAAKRCHVAVAKGDFTARHQAWVESPSPAPHRVEAQSEPTTADDHDVVAAVRRIWAEVIGRAASNDDADLFQEGGDSLTAMRIRSRLERELGCDVPLLQVIHNRTVAGLAALVRERGVEQPVPRPVDIVRGRI